MKGADAPAGSVATPDGRYYERNGRKYISVTNVLDHCISKPVLVPWASKVVAEYAVAHPGADIKEWKRQPKIVKETSAQRGTDIHAWCEQYFLNPELAMDNMPAEYVAECVGFVECIIRNGIVPLAAEATVYSDQHDYAGTNDLFGTCKSMGDIVIGADIKTGKSIYPEYALQLAAYRFADYIGLPDGTDVPVPKVQASAVLHVDHGRTRLVPVRAEMGEFYAFVCLVKGAKWLVEEAKTAIGKEIL